MSWTNHSCRMTLAACFLGMGMLWLTQAAAGLTTPDPSDGFVGTWQAQFQGKTFLVITLANPDGKLSGTISHTTIQLDKNGELTSAEQKDGQDRISDSAVTGNVLRFTSRDQGSEDTTSFELTLTGGDHAQLRLLKAPPDSAAPKPWSLERLSGASASAESKPQDIKSKLAAAAQTWLAGQFGSETTSSAATSASVSGNAAMSASATTAGVTATLKVSSTPLDSGLRHEIDNLPRRVHDRFNNLGDMVNFILVGSQEQMQAALAAASWNVADTDDKEAALKAVLETYQKKDYLAMPMSGLYLFDRRQDFGYEEADPYAVVATRHHFRIWKAPFTCNGQPVWVGAGTHDIGFEKDQRNGKVTHKIDPAVDGERDNIGQTLQGSGKVRSLTYYLPLDPVQDAKNATGGGYHSDGRILVMFLQK
jgi:LssY C-terminus